MLSGGFSIFLNHGFHVQNDSTEILQNNTSPEPIFSPINRHGKQVIVNKEPSKNNGEQLSIWENAQALKDLKDRKTEKASLIKIGESLYSLTTIGRGTDLDNVVWRIQAKRNALSSIALTLIESCKSEDEARNSFLNGKINKVIFNEPTKEVNLTFVTKCTLKM